jgi:hypothetical protein
LLNFFEPNAGKLSPSFDIVELPINLQEMGVIPDVVQTQEGYVWYRACPPAVAQKIDRLVAE